MASPMSPFTFSLPDMKAICPESLLLTMSSQSCAHMVSVKVGSGEAPDVTVHFPSLIVAHQVPP